MGDGGPGETPAGSGAPARRFGCPQLLRAAFKNDLATVEALLSARADPNLPSEDTGCTPLHRAAVRNHEAVVRALLAAGASANLRDDRFQGTAAETAHRHHPGSAVSQLLATVAERQAGETARGAPETAALPEHLEVLAAAFGARAAEGEEGSYTQGHTCVGEEDVREAFLSGSTLLYGELVPESVTEVWGALGVGQRSGEVLLELGMGTGKVSLQAFVELPHLRTVIGVELAPSRYRAGESALRRLAGSMPTRFRVAELEAGVRILLEEHGRADVRRTLEFRCGDALKVDPADMAAADAVVAEFCMPVALHGALCAKMRELRPGVKIFSFTDFPMVWPEDLPGPRCHLRRCAGANGCPSDRYYRTSWERTDGHPFFLLETLGAAAGDAGAAPAECPELGRGGRSLHDARKFAVMASNPSNESWEELQSDFAADGMYRGGQAGDLREVSYTPGQPVEVATRWQYRAEGSGAAEPGGTWLRAWVVRVRGDNSVDVMFLDDGTLEEHCVSGRVRPGHHACAPPPPSP